jgi:hypothetical protein
MPEAAAAVTRERPGFMKLQQKTTQRIRQIKTPSPQLPSALERLLPPLQNPEIWRSKPVYHRRIEDIIRGTYREKWPKRHAKCYTNNVLKTLKTGAVSRCAESPMNIWLKWLHKLHRKLMKEVCELVLTEWCEKVGYRHSAVKPKGWTARGLFEWNGKLGYPAAEFPRSTTSGPV